MTGTTIEIEGMSCGHCVMNVRKALETLDGVSVQDCRIGGAEVKYDESKVTTADIDSAVQKAGYRVVRGGV